MVTQHSYILCWSAKDVDTGEWFGDSIHLHPETMRKDPTNDKHVVKSLWELLNETDIAIAHNGIGFDHKVANTRFVKHGLTAPSPTVAVDTLSIAKAKFNFPSNRLNDLATYLGLGQKEAVEWSDWEGCMNGSLKHFRRMFKYNKKDVELLEAVWLRLRSWDNRSNYNMVSERPDSCPQCGSTKLQRRGSYVTKANRFRRFVCTACGSWSRFASGAANPKSARKTGVS